VVEFANTDAFLQEFRKEGQDHKVIEFDGGPANYSEVLKDLNDGGGGTVFDSGTADYDAPPPNVVKTANQNRDRLGVEEAKLASALVVPEQPIPYENPLQESIELREKLAAAYDGVSSSLSSLEVHYQDVLDHLFHHVKQAALGGATLGEIVAAWSSVNEEPAFMKAAFAQLTPRLLDGGVFPSRGAIGESLTKTAAAGVVNTEHPLVSNYEEFCGTLVKLAKTRAVQKDLLASLDTVSTFIQKVAAGKGVVGAVGKGLKELSEYAGKGGLRAGEVLFGKGTKGAKRTGEAARIATRFGVPLVALEEVHERGTQSPVTRGAARAVTERLPVYMSPAARMRRYRIQQGI
jgi:hypothetical protein